MLLALLKFKQQNYAASFLSLGFGGAFKHFPFLFLPVFLIFLPKNKLKNLETLGSYISLTALPYLFAAIPFIHNSDMTEFMLNFSENTKMLGLTIQLGEQQVSVYLAAFLIIMLNAWFFSKKNFFNLIKTCFLISLIYFLTSHWYVQRLLYLLPFLLILALNIPKVFKLLPWLNLSYFAYVLVGFPEIFDYTLTRPVFFPLLDAYKLPIKLNAAKNQMLVNSLVYGLLITLLLLVIRFQHKPLKKGVKLAWSAIIAQLAGLILYLIYLFSPVVFNF